MSDWERATLALNACTRSASSRNSRSRLYVTLITFDNKTPLDTHTHTQTPEKVQLNSNHLKIDNNVFISFRLSFASSHL